MKNAKYDILQSYKNTLNLRTLINSQWANIGYNELKIMCFVFTKQKQSVKNCCTSEEKSWKLDIKCCKIIIQ